MLRYVRFDEPATSPPPLVIKTHSYLRRDARMQDALAKSLHLCADMVHKRRRGGGGILEGIDGLSR